MSRIKTGFVLERSPRVLIVDSDKSSGKTLTGWLEEHGMKTVWVKSTSEAMELLRDLVYIESVFDGLIVEYDLPDATGCRIIHEFRHEFPGIATAILTDGNDMAVKMWSRSRQVPILLKPVHKADIEGWLARFKTPSLN